MKAHGIKPRERDRERERETASRMANLRACRPFDASSVRRRIRGIPTPLSRLRPKAVQDQTLGEISMRDCHAGIATVDLTVNQPDGL